MPYFQATGDATSPQITLTGKTADTAKGFDWDGVSQKISLLVGVLTLYTMIKQHHDARRR